MGVLPVGKLLAGMAVPMMISMLVQALYNIVDSVFVSRLSENAFNAVGLAFPLQSLMIAVGAGTAVGINALLSRSLGEKKQEMADRGRGYLPAAHLQLSCLCLHRPVPLPALLRGAGQGSAGDRGIRRAVHPDLLRPFPWVFSTSSALSGRCGPPRTSLAMCTAVGRHHHIVMDPILLFDCAAHRMGVAGAAGPPLLDRSWRRSWPDREYPEPTTTFTSAGRTSAGTPSWQERDYRVGVPSIIMQSISSRLDLRHEQDPLRVHPHRHLVRLQDSELHVPSSARTTPIISYNYGAARPQRVEDVAALHHHRHGHHGPWLCHFSAVPPHCWACSTHPETMLAIGVPALRIISVSFLLAGFCIVQALCFRPSAIHLQPHRLRVPPVGGRCPAGRRLRWWSPHGGHVLQPECGGPSHCGGHVQH